MDINENTIKRMTYQPGEYLFHQGDSSYFFFMIEEGDVDVLIKDKAGSELLLATVHPGQPVGEFALVMKKPRVASARAKTPVTAVQISEEGYQKLLQDLPDWAISLVENLIDRLKRTDEKLADLQSKGLKSEADVDTVRYSIKS